MNQNGRIMIAPLELSGGFVTGSIYSNLLIKMNKNNCVISGRFVRVIYFVQTYMNQNGRGIIAPFRLSRVLVINNDSNEEE